MNSMKKKSHVTSSFPAYFINRVPCYLWYRHCVLKHRRTFSKYCSSQRTNNLPNVIFTVHAPKGHITLSSCLFWPRRKKRRYVSLQFSGSLTTPRCKTGTRPWPGNLELTLRIITCKQEQSTGDDGSALALKPMGRVNHTVVRYRVPELFLIQ